MMQYSSPEIGTPAEQNPAERLPPLHPAQAHFFGNYLRSKKREGQVVTSQFVVFALRCMLEMPTMARQTQSKWFAWMKRTYPDIVFASELQQADFVIALRHHDRWAAFGMFKDPAMSMTSPALQHQPPIDIATQESMVTPSPPPFQNQGLSIPPGNGDFTQKLVGDFSYDDFLHGDNFHVFPGPNGTSTGQDEGGDRSSKRAWAS